MSARTSGTTMESGIRPQSGQEVQEKVQENTIPEIPPHWIFERNGHPTNHLYFCWWPLLHCIYHISCVISFGHASLYPIWEVSHQNCSAEVWEHARTLLRERLAHVNIVVRLSAVSMSTLWVLTAISGLGWFAPGCKHGVLYHKPPWDLSRSPWAPDTAIYKTGPLLHSRSIYCIFPRRSGRGVHCRVCHSQSPTRLVPRGSLFLRPLKMIRDAPSVIV